LEFITKGKKMREKLLKSEAESKVEKLEKKLASFQDLPFMRKIEAEGRAANLERRSATAEKIDTITKERDQVVPELKAVLTEKEDAYQTAKAAFETAERALREAKIALSNKSNYYSHLIGIEGQNLIESADPLIDEAIEFFRQKMAWLRGPGRISHGRAGAERNIFTDTKLVKTESNIAAVKVALVYCKEAIETLLAMKLTPSLDVKKIEEMKAAIPDINEYSEYQSEKPLAKVDSNPCFMTDSEYDWRKEKLEEKFKRIIKRKH
jgi:hypothetical protein